MKRAHYQVYAISDVMIVFQSQHNLLSMARRYAKRAEWKYRGMDTFEIAILDTTTNTWL